MYLKHFEAMYEKACAITAAMEQSGCMQIYEKNVAENRMMHGDYDILLHGHTHVPAWEPFGEENLYLNPGSVSIPKNGSARGYLTLEDGVFQWKTLSGDVYHTLTL